jgi:lipopolysaccharide/colanic/teichoic acid biosynthesis glycosyltransferase
MYRYVKRILDVLGAAMVLLVTFPFFIVIAILVWVNIGIPVIFSQARPGLKGKPFIMFKFRTMNRVCDPQGHLLPDADRLTQFGRFLRSTSLDELPELINVLRGDMSFVGPRPLLMEYLNLYTPEQMRRHDVLPGITGWAQVNGRNALTWEEKFAFDVWYVDHQSLLLDVKILVMTMWKVLMREGISQPGRETADKFTG